MVGVVVLEADGDEENDEHNGRDDCGDGRLEEQETRAGG